jgi:hypothetical protein
MGLSERLDHRKLNASQDWTNAQVPRTGENATNPLLPRVRILLAFDHPERSVSRQFQTPAFNINLLAHRFTVLYSGVPNSMGRRSPRDMIFITYCHGSVGGHDNGTKQRCTSGVCSRRIHGTHVCAFVLVVFDGITVR